MAVLRLRLLLQLARTTIVPPVRVDVVAVIAKRRNMSGEDTTLAILGVQASEMCFRERASW
jgi:hypothetical protein